MLSPLGSQQTDSPTPNRMPAPGRRTGRVGYLLRQGVLAALLAAAGAVPALAAEFRLPPIVEPASSEHHPGKIIFVQLVTPDLAASKHFYAGLFGWTFRDLQAGSSRYAEAYLDGRPVAGLLHRDLPAGGVRQPAWLGFFAAADVDAAKKVALQNGAKLLVEPHNVPGRGREAIFADPQGAVFAILSSKSGDPPDVLAAPGDWIWSSLLTSGPDADAAFYQKLFDYEVFELPSDPGVEHLLLASDDYARASVNSLPGNRAKAKPHWLNYVRVEDADQMTAKVVALGGRVLVAAHSDRHGGKVSVVADPQGAHSGLFEWADSESKEVPK
jgi:uncharacterized protein